MKATRATMSLIAMMLAGCGGGQAESNAQPSPSPQPLTVRGSIKAPLRVVDVGLPAGGGSRVEGGPCTTTDGYDDLAEGTQVIVADDGGATLGLGTLRPGVISAAPGNTSIGAARCSFGFVVSGVPATEDFYTVSVGRRGEQKYPRAQLGRALTLSIG